MNIRLIFKRTIKKITGKKIVTKNMNMFLRFGTNLK